MIRYFDAKEAIPLIERLLSDTSTKLAFVNRTNFEFTLDSVKTKFGNESNKNTIAKKAAYLIYSFISGHPLADGNKRTAAFLAELFLQINDVELLVSDEEFLTALINLAAGRTYEKDIRGIHPSKHQVSLMQKQKTTNDVVKELFNKRKDLYKKLAKT